jgi:hypothetical protein
VRCAIRLLDLYADGTLKAQAAQLNKHKWTYMNFVVKLREVFKVNSKEGGRMLREDEVLPKIRAVLLKIQHRLHACGLKFKVEDQDTVDDVVVWLKKKFAGDPNAFPVARASGTDTITFLRPGYPQDPLLSQTMVHETAHLVGVPGDVYVNQKGWDDVKTPERALTMADCFAVFAIAAANIYDVYMKNE